MESLSAKLFQLLSVDLTDLNTLAAILSEEKAAFAARDSARLQALTPQKSQLLKKLENNSRTKARLILDCGLKPVSGQLTALIEQSVNAETASLWNSVQSQLEACKALNQINGKIAQSALQRTNKLMSILRGQASTPSLYGVKGYEKSMSSTYNIAKA